MTKFIAIAILILVASPCFSSTVEFDMTAGRPQIQICVEKPITSKLNALMFNVQSQTWGQTRLGFSYMPVPTVKLGFSAGYETGGNRVGASVWVGKDRFSGFYVAESGASGTWDKLVLKCQITNKFSLGYTKKEFAGKGIYADFKIGENLTAKYSGFKEPEIALQLSF